MLDFKYKSTAHCFSFFLVTCLIHVFKLHTYYEKGGGAERQGGRGVWAPQGAVHGPC